MIRVLQVVGTMDLGGIETFLMNIYRNIDRSKVQFDFLCHNRIEAAYTEEIKSLGGRLFSIKGISHVGFFRYQKSLYDFYKSHPEYRVIHAHQNDLNGIILHQAKKAGIPNRYSHSHTVYPGKRLSYKARVWFFKTLINKSCTRAFACSGPAGEQLYTGDLRKNFIIINNGIDTTRFHFNKDEREIIRVNLSLGEGPVIGHVGRFAPVKNHAFILDCFQSFLQIHSTAKLLLIGTGELEEIIIEKAKSMGISESVLFLGKRNDVNCLMNAMDLFLFPSINEGLPVSVIEAQSSGLFIITSNSISNDIDLTDLVVRMSLTDSAQAWAVRMSSLLDNSRDKDRREYSELIKQKGFDSKSVADELCSLYLSDHNASSKRENS